MTRQDANAGTGDAAMRRPAKRKWLNYAGLAIAVLCMGFFLDRVMSLRSCMPEVSLTTLEPLPLALLVYVAGCLVSARAWTMLLATLGVPTRLSLGVGIFLVSQFGKYLPGNVGQHVGRVTLSTRLGLPMRPVITSMLLETVLVLGIVLLLGLPVLLGYFQLAPLMALGAALAALLAAATLALRRQPVSQARDDIKEAAGGKLKGFACVGLLLGAGVVLSSGGLVLLDPSFLATPGTVLKVASLFCAAWLAGFLTPGAPAGLGIRELILSEGLAPMVGPESAALVAILLRVVTTASDLIALGIGLLLLKRAPQAPSEAVAI